MPNSKLAGDVIYNETKRSQRRVNFSVGLEYKTPPENLEAFVKAVETLLAKDDDVIGDSVKVWFDAFADSSLNVGVIYRISKSDYYDMLTVKDRVNFAIQKAAKDARRIHGPSRRSASTTRSRGRLLLFLQKRRKQEKTTIGRAVRGHRHFKRHRINHDSTIILFIFCRFQENKVFCFTKNITYDIVLLEEFPPYIILTT